MPARMLDSVVLPAPFSPSSTCTSPARNSRSTSDRAGTPSKLFERCRATTTGAGPPSSALDAGDTLYGPVDEVRLLGVEGLALRQPLLALVVLDRAGVRVERLVEQLRAELVDFGADILRHLVTPVAEVERQQVRLRLGHPRPRQRGVGLLEVVRTEVELERVDVDVGAELPHVGV